MEVWDKDKLDGNLRLYERQMTHYEKTQDVEWKGSFGIWTLLAAGIAWALKDRFAIPADAWRFALIGVVSVHTLWLLLVHQSEEADKKLWSRYRDSADAMLGHAVSTKRSGWCQRLGLRIYWLGRRLLWLAVEAGITAGLAVLLWSLVNR